MKSMQVARLPAYITGIVNQELVLQKEYLAAENRILRAHLPVRHRLTDPQCFSLAEMANDSAVEPCSRLPVAKPDSISWYRNLTAHKFDTSQ